MLDTLLRRLEEEGLVSAIGPAAALTAALVTGVTESAARRSAGSWEDAGAVIAQAVALRRRALRLAREDVEAHGAASAALDAAEQQRGDDAGLGEALDRAADVPLRIAETAADAAVLAAVVAERAEPALRADAAGAALLAGGVARASVHLIEVNLATRRDDPRLAQAHDLIALANAAADRARSASG